MEDAPDQQGSQIVEYQHDKKRKLLRTDAENLNEVLIRMITKARRESGADPVEDFRRWQNMDGRLENLGRWKDSPIMTKSGEGITTIFGSKNVFQQLPPGPDRTSVISTGICKNLDRTLVHCQVLVLTPTHKQAQKVEKLIRVEGGDELGIKVHARLAETISVSEDIQVVVGTPADVLDMMRNKSLTPDNIKMFILDGADQMLSRGFEDQIYDIFLMLPSDFQLGVFTESIYPELAQFTRRILYHPRREAEISARRAGLVRSLAEGYQNLPRGRHLD